MAMAFINVLGMGPENEGLFKDGKKHGHGVARGVDGTYFEEYC